MSRAEIQFSVPETGLGAIDWAQLGRVTLGDAALAHEVLGLFDVQAADVAAAIRDLPVDTAMLVHGLKGASRSIGAWAVADSAQEVEAALRSSADPVPAVEVLVRNIAAARRAIAMHLSGA